MESEVNKKYQKVYISFQISESANRLLTESSKRSGRKKIQEAKLRLEDHLHRFQSISEINQAVLNNCDTLEVDHDYTSHS